MKRSFWSGMLVLAVLAGMGAGVYAMDADANANRFRELPVAHKFDFPVGAPDASGWFDAQSFGENFHLGSDWNRRGAAFEDLGAPVYVVADGVVSWSGDAGEGWGNVVRVVHHVRERHESVWVESVYAHLDELNVAEGQRLDRGQRVGTVGDANGRYEPHLHFEIRSVPDMPLGPGYSIRHDGWLDPTAFILAHR